MKHQLSIWKEQDNPMVRMHNEIVTANFGYLELNAMRVFLLMLAKLDRDAEDFTPMRINVRDVIPNFDGGTSLEYIIKACKELKTKIRDLEIISEHKGKRRFKLMTVIDFVEYIENTEYIEARFGVAIRPYLLQLKGNFTQAELKELMKLKSTYAIRMYMLIKSLYREGMTYETTVNDYKLMMVGNLTQYADYRNFKRVVISSSQKALSKTSSAFTFEEEKTGKFITKLRFIPSDYPEAKLTGKVLSDALQASLEELKVNTVKITEMVKAGVVTEDYIKFVIEAKKKDTKVKKLGATIYEAIVYKYLYDDYRKTVYQSRKPKTTPTHTATSPADSGFTTITLAEAEKQYQEYQTSGKAKFKSLNSFIYGLKMQKVLVEGQF